ncbi:hypothetical protein AVEN_264741-1 [Araneus ventricosus]|uniref:Rad21/Rec8-like protein N-terminal domain-containing protein n=1 Tax=Araneus ventricosus TaxID=182803 RepID=A0A4Y2ECJ5_ARAVE|nr:hypothetical protein AVEN_264741-1 [Araneus ventricosus]
MFYSHEILQKRGKFGIIWLAATCRQRITKRDIWRVNVANSCEDVIDTVMRRPVAERRSAPLSLYLASQLMFGLTYVSAKQHEFLLEDIKTLIIRLGMFKVPVGSVIDLDKALDGSKVTMTFNMDNVPLEFGSFKSIQDPLSYYWGDYFDIPTPKSSEEALSFISAEQERDIDMLDEGAEMLHRAHPADITMQEVPELSEEPIPEEIPEEPVDFLSDFPPLEEAPLEPSVPLPETQQAAPVPADVHHLSFLLSPEDVPVLEETLQSRQGVEPSSGDMTIQGTSPVIQPRTSIADFESFTLGPVPAPGRRRPRRRHLIIDPVTCISSEQLRAQLSRVDTQTVPAYLRRASLHELPESMFRRLSSQLVPSGIRNRLRRLQTLQQPTDLFPYVVGLPDEPSSPEGAEMLREEEEEESAPSAPPISETFPSVEMQRDATASTIDPSASALLRTSSLKVTGLSSSASLMGRDASDLLQPPMVQDEEEYMMPIPELSMRDLEEVHETAVPMPPICEISPVSPERTPPPSSAESLTPALEETHLLVLKTLKGSGLSHLTTFNSILRNVTQTKRRVAELFNHLIHLHARGLVYLEQPVADGDIFIKLSH